MQRDLVERARKGDHDAFAELAGAAISRLDSAAWLILRDPEQAADAVQNALVRAWRDLPTLRDPERFEAWLHRLLVRSCIDESRRLRRHRIDIALTTLDAPVHADHESAVADRDQLERGFVRLEPVCSASPPPRPRPRQGIRRSGIASTYGPATKPSLRQRHSTSTTASSSPLVKTRSGSATSSSTWMEPT